MVLWFGFEMPLLSWTLFGPRFDFGAIDWSLVPWPTLSLMFGFEGIDWGAWPIGKPFSWGGIELPVIGKSPGCAPAGGGGGFGFFGFFGRRMDASAAAGGEGHEQTPAAGRRLSECTPTIDWGAVNWAGLSPTFSIPAGPLGFGLPAGFSLPSFGGVSLPGFGGLSCPLLGFSSLGFPLLDWGSIDWGGGGFAWPDLCELFGFPLGGIGLGSLGFTPLTFGSCGFGLPGLAGISCPLLGFGSLGVPVLDWGSVDWSVLDFGALGGLFGFPAAFAGPFPATFNFGGCAMPVLGPTEIDWPSVPWADVGTEPGFVIPGLELPEGVEVPSALPLPSSGLFGFPGTFNFGGCAMPVLGPGADFSIIDWANVPWTDVGTEPGFDIPGLELPAGVEVPVIPSPAPPAPPLMPPPDCQCMCAEEPAEMELTYDSALSGSEKIVLSSSTGVTLEATKDYDSTHLEGKPQGLTFSGDKVNMEDFGSGGGGGFFGGFGRRLSDSRSRRLTDTESALKFTASEPITTISFKDLSGFDRKLGRNSPQDCFAMNIPGHWVIDNGAALDSYNLETGVGLYGGPSISESDSSFHELIAKGAKSDVLFCSTLGGVTNGADVTFVADEPFTECVMLYEDVSQGGNREYVGSDFNLASATVESMTSSNVFECVNSCGSCTMPTANPPTPPTPPTPSPLILPPPPPPSESPLPPPLPLESPPLPPTPPVSSTMTVVPAVTVGFSFSLVPVAPVTTLLLTFGFFGMILPVTAVSFTPLLGVAGGFDFTILTPPPPPPPVFGFPLLFGRRMSEEPCTSNAAFDEAAGIMSPDTSGEASPTAECITRMVANPAFANVMGSLANATVTKEGTVKTVHKVVPKPKIIYAIIHGYATSEFWRVWSDGAAKALPPSSHVALTLYTEYSISQTVTAVETACADELTTGVVLTLPYTCHESEPILSAIKACAKEVPFVLANTDTGYSCYDGWAGFVGSANYEMGKTCGALVNTPELGAASAGKVAPKVSPAGLAHIPA